jgi:hypothetical protein
MNIDFNNPATTAREMFYKMYGQTKIASKKDVHQCLIVAIDYMIELTPDRKEYFDNLKQELKLIWA